MSSTKELFLLNNPVSKISQKYIRSICEILSKGIKIFAVGSWNDQVVPLYSATLHSISSPPVFELNGANLTPKFGNLIRSVFVEAEIFQYDFLVALTRLCFRIENLGHRTDLLVHLSGFLRGRLLSIKPGSHITGYSNDDVYMYVGCFN